EAARAADTDAHAAAPAPRPGQSSAAPTAAAPKAGLGQDGVLLNFVDADIPAVLRVLARYTGRHFLVDARVKGTLTLVSQGPVAPDTAYGMLLGALRMQGFAVVDVAGGTRVVPEADAKLQGGPVASGTGATAPADGAVVTRTFRLSYENAAALVPVLRPMIAPNNPITAYPANNTLVITDYADNLDRIGRIIASIDNPSSLVTEVVKIRQGIAVDIAGMAAELLDTQQGGDPTQRVAVVADPRANSVILRSSSPGRARLARDLIRQLDSSQADPGNLHVVYLRNAQATHLAKVLRGLLTGEGDGVAAGGDAAVRAALSAGGGLGGASAGGGVAGAAGASAATASAGANASANGSGGMARGAYGARGADGGLQGNVGRKGESGTFAAGGVTVQADATTNTLIIAAPEPMYRSLRKVIDLLDQRRAQVLVESLIVEVTERDASQLGIQWMLGGGRVYGGANFGGSGIVQGAKNSIDALPRGLSIGVVRGTINIPGVGEVANLQMLARALQTTGGSNILSTPNLLTLDNEPASIMVGKTVPFVSGQYVTPGSTNSNPFQTIQREDIGLKLNIRPQISEGGTVKLDIYQEVSSIDGQTSEAAAGLVTNKRAMDTSVLLDDGQIMVLGGLLEDSVVNGRDAVPVLGSIPVLGALFRYDTRERVKTNLMVFLRPYVVRDSADGQGLTQSRYNFMRRAQGRVQPPGNPLLPDMSAPVLPPPGVPVAGDPYDLRTAALAETMQRNPPGTQIESRRRELPAEPDKGQEPPMRTRLPAGLTVASDPAALYGEKNASASVLQFADAPTDREAEQIARRVQVSGLKAYALLGPGGSGYVVRASVPRDPRSVDTALQLLRELGYQPELVLAP
ncbi:type II secretion system secretin GspD, partial [Achromobacter xylosoxidans]|uniref:type II secretion system secretin GspD n=2 Tax=Alcaligenes xylosoxydans xylosoxydans TaxID=85698 RepID=UPI001F143BD2